VRLSFLPVLAACVSSSDAQGALNSRFTLPPGLTVGEGVISRLSEPGSR